MGDGFLVRRYLIVFAQIIPIVQCIIRVVAYIRCIVELLRLDGRPVVVVFDVDGEVSMLLLLLLVLLLMMMMQLIHREYAFCNNL